jgi:hypothetical protein
VFTLFASTTAAVSAAGERLAVGVRTGSAATYSFVAVVS